MPSHILTIEQPSLITSSAAHIRTVLINAADKPTLDSVETYVRDHLAVYARDWMVYRGGSHVAILRKSEGQHAQRAAIITPVQ